MKLLALLSLFPTCFSLNILLFLIGTNQFERSTFEFLAQQLALRNHEVITVKPILIPEEPRLVKPKLHLVREKTIKNMLPKKLYEPLEKAGNNIPWSNNYEEEGMQRVYWAAHNASCYKMLNSNLMDTLKKDSIDVAIVYAGNPCQLAITHVLAIPTIYFDLEGITDETLVAAGAPFDLDIAPSSCFLPNVSPWFMRLRNGICYLKEHLIQTGLPLMPSLLSEKYRNLDGPITDMFANDYTLKKRFKSFPDANQLRKQSALFFVNSDVVLEDARALPSNVVYVGGLHVDQPKPLFSPWNTTINAAESGMIVVSLGTQVNNTAMTETQAKSILGALSKLTKYRIYWRVGPNVKLPGIENDDIPKHINLTAFLPQNDLLAQKTCRLIITNGGMSTIMEAVTYGVPIVGIPLYGGNRHNLDKIVNKKIGLSVAKNELTESSLLKAITTVLNSARYKTAAKDMSKEFKSRGFTPFSTALHYIEHVGRHHKAAFFESKNRNVILLLNLDLICGILLLALAIIALPHKLLGFSCRMLGKEKGKKIETVKQSESKKEK